ncbi:MAG: FeoB small GTPase domain-containing protein, partial [Rhodocyclaceae bacterium]
MIGQARVGKSRIFRAASSTVVHHERLAGVGPAYDECQVEVGLDQISLVDLPPVETFHTLSHDTAVILKYLLWGDRWPPIARHEAMQPHSPFAAPDVLLLVMDATSLERDIELALELTQIGKPMVIALNRMDEARAKRMFIDVGALTEKLGAPVVPTVAHMGLGLAELFSTIVRTAREKRAPTPQPPSPYIAAYLAPIAEIAMNPAVVGAFAVPASFLALQLAENDDYFSQELRSHFPHLHRALLAARETADR